MATHGDDMQLSELTERLKASRGSVTGLSGTEWKTRSGPEIAADVDRVSRALEAAGASEGMRIGIVGTNSYDWVVADLAVLGMRCVSVAVPEALHGELEAVAVRCGLALTIACGEGAGAPREPWIMRLRNADFEEPPRSKKVRAGAVRLSAKTALDTPMLVFSSGSSGRLKCLSISRAGVEAVVTQFAGAYGVQRRDVSLVFLPLSNLQQRAIVYGALWFDLESVVVPPTALFRALRDRRPTVLIGPPLLFETIHGRYLELPSWKRFVTGATSVLLRIAPAPLRRRLQSVLFKEIHGPFGGRLRLAITGMAKIKESTLRFFRDVGVPLFEAYGLTECGIISGNRPGAVRVGSVGKPLHPGTVTLAPDGEILFESPTPLSTGYFDEPEEAQTFCGPLIRTGDIGCFDDDGFLRIVGRKKEIIVTTGGLKLHPEVLEAEINECPLVDRSAALGGETAAGLTAVVTVRRPMLPSEVRQVEAHVRSVSSRLAVGVRVGAIVISEVPFSLEAGTLTRNLKLNRARIREVFGQP